MERGWKERERLECLWHKYGVKQFLRCNGLVFFPTFSLTALRDEFPFEVGSCRGLRLTIINVIHTCTLKDEILLVYRINLTIYCSFFMFAVCATAHSPSHRFTFLQHSFAVHSAFSRFSVISRENMNECTIFNLAFYSVE